MRTSVGFVLAATLFALTPSAWAHVAEGTIAMTADQEVPPPPGTPPGAGGIATLELEDDLTIKYEVTVHDLSSPVLFGHIHPGKRGENGAPLFTLTKTDATTFQGETAALTPEQVDTLFAGGFYVNVHTMNNPGGEVRGQIEGLEIVVGLCSCTLAHTAFVKCVKTEIGKLDKDTKKSKAARMLKRAAKKSSCGLSQTSKPLACCVRSIQLGEEGENIPDIVTGTLCVPVKKESQCKAFDGTVVQGQACAPDNPCFLAAP